MDVPTGLRLVIGAPVLGVLLTLSSCGGGKGGGGATPTASALLASGPAVSVTSSTVFRSALGPGENEWIRDAITTGADFQGEVKFELYNGAGQPVASKAFANVSIAAGATQVLEYNYTLPPALPDGRYTSLLTVTDSTGQVLLRQQPGAYFDVAACQTQACVVDPVLSAYPLTPGQLESMQVTLKATNAISNAQAEIRVLNAAGTIVASKAINPVSLAAGSSMPLQFDWQTAASLPLGRYQLVVGVWDQNWVPYGYYTLVSFDAATASPAPVPRTNFSAEAERGTMAGTGVSVQQEPTANNGAYVGNFSPAGTSGSVTMTIPNVAQGTYDVAIRFRNYGTQHNSVQVNGGPVQDTLFISRNNDWNEAVVPRQLLLEGTNTFNISKGWGYTDIDSIRISASSPTGGAPGPVPSIAVADWIDTILQDGDYFVFTDVWNRDPNLTRGTYTGMGGSQYEQQIGIENPARNAGGGPVAARFTWKWPTGNTTTSEVKSYPSILAGNKPGWAAPTWANPGGFPIRLPDGTTSDVVPSGKTPNSFFPLPLPLASLKSTFAYTYNQPSTGRGQLTYDLWLQNTPDQKTGFNTDNAITTEIMIPLDFWGGYGQYIAGGGGRNPSWYSHDATIDGLPWHVFHALPKQSDPPGPGQFSAPWHFIVFEPAGPVPNRTLDLAAFVNYAIAQGWTGGATHCVSVELGVEPVDGTGDITISNFSVTR